MNTSALPIDASDRPDDLIVAKIVDTLRDSIITGAIAPATQINSVELSHRFGTSRTPVREALMKLSQYGLVTLSARRRPQVASVSVRAIRELYALRTALHISISESIVLEASDEALIRLRSDARTLLDDADTVPIEAHLRQIEHYLKTEIDLAGNSLIRDTLDNLQWRIAWYRRLGAMSREQIATLAPDRLRVAEAYIERDAALAIALNRSMLRKAASYCEQNFVRMQQSTEPTCGTE